MIVNYDGNCSFIVLATVITIVNYNRKTFIVQATGVIQCINEVSYGLRCTTIWFWKPIRGQTLIINLTVPLL
jgi:hypothetical protein